MKLTDTESDISKHLRVGVDDGKKRESGMTTMAEYIEREALIAEYDRVHIGEAGGARKLMVEAPAADVVEVVHGRWIEKGYEGIMTYCSECLHRAPFNNHQELILSNYCPNCGAKMDGERRSDDG